MEKILWQSRDELPDILNRLGLLGVGVEVGVERAHHACALRKRWNGKLLICVDKWDVNPNYAACDKARHDSSRTEAFRNLAQFGGAVEIMEMWSLDAAKKIEADCLATDKLVPPLDFVYLDADHSYEAVKADIATWRKLIKPGGIIAGHDWVVDGFHVPDHPFEAHEVSPGGMACPFGVRKAVKEAFGDNVSVTSPQTDGGWQSWAVRL